MTTVSDKKENCSGCGVCKAVCRENAVVMRRDADGFYYPEIDTERCVHCGKCRKSCPFIRKPAPRDPFCEVFAVQSKETEILKRSQSGGLFAELAKSILNAGGAVYGAAFNDAFEVCHIRIDTEEQLCRLQGSKYVQSRTEDIFRAVKCDLIDGLAVLFSGTPCQVAALYAYLDRKYESLYTADIVCHGVMPPSLWESYLAWIRKKYGNITHADFRDKSFGWRSHYETFTVGKKKIKKNVYRKIFYKNVLLRPCCCSREGDRYKAVCRYAGMPRVSDITIGDFWGIKNESALFQNADRGISLCIVNTQKGLSLFETIRQNVIWERRDISEASEKQPHLSRREDGVPIKEVEKARRRYSEKGFRYIASKYGENGVGGLYPKGVRFIRHVANTIRGKVRSGTERREKQ